MKLLTMLIMVTFSACGSGYDNHDLELLTRYRAKDLCSCVFVQNRDDQYCIDWTVASPDLATVRIDHETQTVTTEAMFFWAGKARFVDARRGCVLE
jgi:hypothetical protein